MHAWGWLQDRREDLKIEQSEIKLRHFMLRCYRHSLPRQQLWELCRSGLLGPDLRALSTAAYSPALERNMRRAMPGGNMRRAMPGGPTVFRLDTLWVLAATGWVCVPAVLDPVYHNSIPSCAGLGINPDMAAVLGIQSGSVLLYSIAGEELSGFVSEVPIPDQAMALSKAQHEATAASQPLAQQQLARRATDIIDERRRCVVVPAEALQALLRAGISVNIG